MYCLLVLCAGLSAPADAAPLGVTLDRDGDGRVDAVRVGSQVVDVREGKVDTARRPVVRAGGLRVRPRDGAAPVLVRAAVRGRTVTLTWSEPLRGTISGLSLRGSSATLRTSVTVRGSRVMLRAAGGAPVAVALAGRGVRDAAGNAARPFGVRALAGRKSTGAARPAGPAAASSGGTAASGGSAGATTSGGGDTSAAAGTGGDAGASGDTATTGDDAAAGWHTLADPIDPRQQTALGFCQRSHWLQPWRAYLDTRPASALSGALGINLNVAPHEWTPTADLLAQAGFTRARAEVGWDAMDFADPTRLRDANGLATAAKELHQRGLRPLVLLNANEGAPGPLRKHTLTLAAPAPAGARTVVLAPGQSVDPGLTGFVGGGMAPEVLVTSVSDTGVATLSKPLPRALASGAHDAVTLRYEPFGAPSTAAFERTLTGWLAYVDAVTTTLRQAIGDEFDIEIWNELSFGSSFLSPAAYYDPVPQHLAGTGDVTDAILRRTVEHVRAKAELTGVGITNGFASQTPFPAGSTSPQGLTALSKHPYAGPRYEFGGAGGASLPCLALDALGALTDLTPSYTSYFPEYYLNAIQTEHLIRDVSPLTTDVYGTPHGRAANPEIWVTETNMDPGYIGQSAEQTRRMQAKSALRTLVSFVSKGVSVVDFYAARGDQFGLIDPRFFTTGNPADAGLTMGALSRLVERTGTGTPATKRTLTLEAIADRGTRVQHPGGGTASTPPLFDRDVVAAFPFQASDHRFVIPAYVMTRNVATELAPADFRLTFGGVDARTASVSAYDPLTGETTPAAIVARGTDQVTIQLPLTDSPRLIEVAD